MAEIKVKSGNGAGCLNLLGWFLGLNAIWLLLAVFAAFLGWRSYTLSVNGEAVTGAVVSLVEDDHSDYFTDIYPVVEFEVNGEIYSIRSQNNYRWWNRFIRFPIGRQVEMRYDPANPENAEINSWVDLWEEPIILGVFTVISAIGVNMFLFLRWRSQRKTQAAHEL